MFRSQVHECCVQAEAFRTLVKGLNKAIADPATEWIDANIVRLLLDRAASPREEGVSQMPC